jgi:aminoacylase
MKKRKLGDVTTINLTMLKSGVSVDGGKTYALNVIPNEAVAGFDVRISPSMDIKQFENLLNEWCSDEGVSWEFAPNTNPFRRHYATSLEKDNVWWNLFQESCEVN